MLSWCTTKREYILFFYTDKDNIWDESTWRMTEGIKDIERCRLMAKTLLEMYPDWDYECWYNCEFRVRSQMHICDKTIR